MAFQAEPGSQILTDHPEWFADPLLGGLIHYSESILDVSNPQAQAHLVELMQRLTGWGCEWIKLDFAYRALLTENWYDPDITRFEFYREGVKLLHETLGNDVFFLNVALVGPNLGLIDALRLTLDVMPAWEGTAQDPYSPLSMFNNQGFKPMYRDSARRYYLHSRVWINHPDLIFFRSDADITIPPLTLNETQTFATSIVMQGGLVKLGDRLVDLSPEAIDTIRKLLPVYGKGGRPLDLMRREFPETWSLPIEDFPEPYHVLGLLNWGLNRDLTTLPFSWVEDDAREIDVNLEEAGLNPDQAYLAFEFWTQEFLGEFSGQFSLDVPARTPRVVALHPKSDRPQLIGTNRHVLGGVKVISSLEWDGNAKSLTGVQEGSMGTEFEPFTHRLTFYVPDGYSAVNAVVTAPQGYTIENKTLTTDGNIATLQFAVTELLNARKADGVSRFPDVTWSIIFE